jgi:hypothetical protein
VGNEVYVLHDRPRIIEKMLEVKGSISRADIEAYKPTPEEEEEIRKDADAFMAQLFCGKQTVFMDFAGDAYYEPAAAKKGVVLNPAR